VVSGQGTVRHQDGTSAIEPGDAFIFEPGQPHQLINGGSQDMIVYVIADNPIGESNYLHDSKKWLVRSPERALIRGLDAEYYDGEE
jgi:mannose-6-phosphate isomerase-like protein (cupin superfamily)